MNDVSTDEPIRRRVRKEMEENNPPIEAGQVWVAKHEQEGKVKIMRRVRILAPYPDEGGIQSNRNEKLWIYEELSGGVFRTEIGRLGVFPEFNLRYFAELDASA